MHEDERYMQTLLDSLKNAIQEIQNKNNIRDLSFGELYNNVYTMVSYNHSDMLYNGVKEAATNHLVQKVRADVLASSGRHFLQSLNEAWIDHQACMVMIKNILLYLDHAYIHKRSVYNVYDLGLTIFRNEVVLDGCIRDHLTETLLDMVMRERRGEWVDWFAIKNACEMLLRLGIGSRSVYEEVFEEPFLSQSAAFYRVESQKFLKENSAFMYIKKVEQRINKEAEHARRYLDELTEDHIVKVVMEELISMHLKTIIEMENSGLVHMLRNLETEALACMYKLFSHIPEGLEMMLKYVTCYLEEQGTALVSEEEGGPLILVRNLLDLKKRSDQFLYDSFGGNRNWEKTFSCIFESFLNLNPKLPEYLSLFLDHQMRKRATEQQIEEVLDKTIELFRYLREKDVFEKYYRGHLVKRLLYNKSVSDDSEQNMISKLKMECGFKFTFTLEKMFNDLFVSSMMMEEFKVYVSASGVNLYNVDLNVRVLTPVFWPLKSATCILPLAANHAFQAFTQFYKSKHPGRHVQLHPQIGSVDLKAFFPRHDKKTISSYTLQVSTYQMCILMLFNSSEQWTYEEILKAINIPKEYLGRVLEPLALGKTGQRILLKMPKTKEFDPSDKFVVNDSFSSKLHRIKIQAVAAKVDSDSERKETLEKVNEERKHKIEAAIVRIMKTRKRMAHADLLEEVRKQLTCRFPLDPVAVKRRIECLLDKEYLARDTRDRETYTYI